MIYLQAILWAMVVLGCLLWGKRYFRGGVYVGVRPDLRGCVAVVTGGGSGLGKETARQLAIQGCKVVIADVVDSLGIADEINKEVGCVRVQYEWLDLGDLQSIKDFADRIKYTKIDFLVNNAGVMGLPALTFTKSGFQSHCGINYIGHFYLTHLLWPKLNNSAYFRVVILCSITHKRINGFGKPTTLDMGKFNFQNCKYDKNLAYARSKLYLALFTRALKQEIYDGKGIAVAVHPGIVRSNITRHMFGSPLLALVFQLISPFYWFFTKNCIQGVQTVLYALYTDPKNLKSGGFYSDCAVASYNPLVEIHWKKLFQLSEQLLGIKFGE